MWFEPRFPAQKPLWPHSGSNTPHSRWSKRCLSPGAQWNSWHLKDSESRLVSPCLWLLIKVKFKTVIVLNWSEPKGSPTWKARLICVVYLTLVSICHPVTEQATVEANPVWFQLDQCWIRHGVKLVSFGIEPATSDPKSERADHNTTAATHSINQPQYKTTFLVGSVVNYSKRTVWF